MYKTILSRIQKMNRRVKVLSFLNLSLFLFFAAVSSFAFNGGDGTMSDPYQIATREHLETVNNELDACYVLINDIDLAGTTYVSSVISFNTSPGSEFAGFSFTGGFDGGGFSILNLKIEAPSESYVGLFGRLGADAVVENLNIESCSISGGSYIGGICGSNAGGWYGEINNCSVSGTITAAGDCAGGIAGICEEESVVKSSHSWAQVNGANYVGGLIGLNDWECETTDSYSQCHVNGASYVGGLVGENYGSYINDSWSRSNVTGTGDYVGGIAGLNSEGGQINESFSDGTVTGVNHTGGIAGANKDLAYIENSYSSSAASGASSVGGLTGHNFYASIVNCYSTGVVTGSGDYVGAMVGMNQGRSFGCFWNTDTAGVSAGGAGKGLTTEQMKDAVYYRQIGWSGDYWKIDDQIDFPRLIWQDTAGEAITSLLDMPFNGDGSEDDPYQILTADDFAMLSWWDVRGKNFILMSDIDLTGIKVYPIEQFNGIFEGNAYTISNGVVYEPLTAECGFFAAIEVPCQIKNIRFVNCSVEGFFRTGGLAGKSGYDTSIHNCSFDGTVIGNDNSTGGLLGHHQGSITDSHATATVTGWQKSTGGLVGYNLDGTISRCFSNSNVTGYQQRVGGLVGWSGGVIINCYAHGNATGDTKVAGLLGTNYMGKVIRCYSTTKVTGNDSLGGLVGTRNSQGDYEDTGNLWDKQTSQMTSSVMGEGKTTTEMKTITTFTDELWDFVNTWDMPQDSYPLFREKQHTADINADSYVDLEDIELFAQNWLSRGCREPYWCGGGDINSDGKVCLIDFTAIAESWDGGSVLFKDGFESGDFSQYPWQHTTSIPWSVVDSESSEGAYSAKSGAIGHSQTTSLEITVTSEASNISFFCKVSSESGYDHLVFYINGYQQKKLSGYIDWTLYSFDISPGKNTFKWSYTKDSSVSGGSDCVWIDLVVTQ
jgi:hypothetical protein